MRYLNKWPLCGGLPAIFDQSVADHVDGAVCPIRLSTGKPDELILISVERESRAAQIARGSSGSFGLSVLAENSLWRMLC
jgi:hypothetical protein